MTLEEMIKKRNELNRCINEMKNHTLVCGRAKFSRDPNWTKEQWCVTITRILDDGCESREKNSAIIRSCERNKCIEHIDEILSDLRGLKELMEGEDGLL